MFRFSISFMCNITIKCRILAETHSTMAGYRAGTLKNIDFCCLENPWLRRNNLNVDLQKYNSSNVHYKLPYTDHVHNLQGYIPQRHLLQKLCSVIKPTSLL